MEIYARLRRRMRLLVRSEHGMALPTALFATVASLGLASAAVMSSVDVQRGTKRDSDSKSAIASVDAGVNVARMRLNRYQAGLSEKTPCIGPAGEAQTPVAGWCPATAPETVGASTFSYQFSAVGGGVCGGYDLCVVATGSADGVTRRVQVTFDGDGLVGSGNEEKEGEEKEGKEGVSEKGNKGGWGGGSEGVIGVDKVEIYNNADARVGVGTNGDVVVHNNANVCGNVRHGVGKKATFENNADQCDGYTTTEGNATMPPVTSFMPVSIATNNSNYRLVKCTKTSPVKEPVGCQSDTYNKSWSSTEPWNPSTRTINASNNATLTLGGGDYFVCKLELSNNVDLIMAEGSQVRIFFDTPENCKLTAGAKQIYIRNNAAVTSTGYQPDEDQFAMPGFYVIGSPTIPTTVEWKNNSGNANELILYAPNSNVILENNATFYGAVAGKTVLLENNVEVTRDEGFEIPPGLDPWQKQGSETAEEESKEGETEGGETEGYVYYTPQHYVECTGIPGPGEAPNASC